MKQTIKEVIVKYIGQLLIIITVCLIAVFAYSMWRDRHEKVKYAELLNTKDKYEQLNKYVAKLESEYKTEKELHEMAKKTWSEISHTKDAKIKALSDATYIIGKNVNKQNGPDYYFTTPNNTKNYILNEYRLEGNKSPALGYIMIKSDGSVYKRSYKFDIDVKTLETKNKETGKVSFYSKAYLTIKEPSLLAKRVDGYDDWYNKPYSLTINGGTIVADPTEEALHKQFYFWAPHVALGVSVGANIDGFLLRPTLDFSPFGYGITKNDLDFKFLSLGLDFTQKDLGLHILPISYRFWPSLLSNTFISPGIGMSPRGWNGQINLNVTL